MGMPKVSVLLPVRDALPWLASSAASLARQTLAEYEVIAVDDGSGDGSGELLEGIARRDPRWVVRHTGRLGLPAALNLALSLARAPVIARHDADDLSHRRRLERQFDRLERDSGVDVVGCRVRLFPRHEVGVGMRRWEAWHNSLLTHDEMRRELLLDSPLAHGSAMIRRETLERAGGWHERGWAEDLDLWVRLFEAGARFGKCMEPLYGWRQHQQSSTRTDARYSHAAFLALKLESLDRGLLGGGRRATLLGVGSSLERWRRALGKRLAGVHEIRGAVPSSPAGLDPPLVLALMAPSARRRWRAHLGGSGMRELEDFIFVS